MTAPAHRAESAESGSTPPLGCPAHANGTNIAVPLYGPEFAADPESTYALLRRYGPAAPVELAPGVRATLVTSYNTALKVLRTPRYFRRTPVGGGPRPTARFRLTVPSRRS